MSKSGLYAHFRSKEELQLATIAEAERIFEREVLVPARREPEGIRRILAPTDAYLSYLERRVIPGDCFFAATSAELGGREGPVAPSMRLPIVTSPTSYGRPGLPVRSTPQPCRATGLSKSTRCRSAPTQRSYRSPTPPTWPGHVEPSGLDY